MSSADRPTRCWGLLRARQCLLPTARGWLVLLVAGAGLSTLLVFAVPPFLAPIEPVHGGALVVEGWATDDSIRAAVAEFKAHPYQKLYVTGGPLERGAILAEYRTYAELSAANAIALGLPAASVQAVPAPDVARDRTYFAAVALRDWLREQGATPKTVHVLSVGAHARRTRLLFQKALGPEVAVGVTALPDRSFDPQRWWQSSDGVRTIISEVIAYLYARLLFQPPPA